MTEVVSSWFLRSFERCLPAYRVSLCDPGAKLNVCLCVFKHPSPLFRLTQFAVGAEKAPARCRLIQKPRIGTRNEQCSVCPSLGCTFHLLSLHNTCDSVDTDLHFQCNKDSQEEVDHNPEGWLARYCAQVLPCQSLWHKWIQQCHHCPSLGRNASINTLPFAADTELPAMSHITGPRLRNFDWWATWAATLTDLRSHRPPPQFSFSPQISATLFCKKRQDDIEKNV